MGAGAPPGLTCADSGLRICFAKLCSMMNIAKERTCASSRKLPPSEVQAGPDQQPLVKAALWARIARL